MSATIVPFPKKTEQNTSAIEGVVREWLAKLTTDPNLTEHVLQRMLAFIDTYASKEFEPNFNLVVPPGLTNQQVDDLLASIEKGMDATALQVQEMINKIIIERFFLEVDIYESNNRAKNKNWPSLDV